MHRGDEGPEDIAVPRFPGDEPSQNGVNDRSRACAKALQTEDGYSLITIAVQNSRIRDASSKNTTGVQFVFGSWKVNPEHCSGALGDSVVSAVPSAH